MTPTMKIDSAAVGDCWRLLVVHMSWFWPSCCWDYIESTLWSIDWAETFVELATPDPTHGYVFFKSGCRNENRTGPMFLREDCGIPMVSSIFSQPNRPNDSCAPLLAVLFFEFTNFQSPDPAESLTSGFTGRPNQGIPHHESSMLTICLGL